MACDRTDEAHSSYLDLAVRAAGLFGIDVAGVDLICPDITRPFSDDDEAAIFEVNPGPDICWHIFPAEGLSRPVADWFLGYLFSDVN